MSILIQNTALTNTFGFLRNRVNEMAFAFSNKLVTADSNTTTGNVSIDGTLSIGNTSVNSTANSTVLNISVGDFGTLITVGSNVSINTSTIKIGNSVSNVELSQTGLLINGSELIYSLALSAQTSGTSAHLVDALAKTSYRGAEYVTTIKNNDANAVQISKILVLQDGGTSGYVTEFGIVYSNNHLGAFTANANSTHLRLYFTPTVSNTQLNSVRSVIALV